MLPSAEQVLVEHAALVNAVVGWALRRIGGTQCVIDRDDLAQHARIALLKAHGEFDGSGEFGGFAIQRMRWAVMDLIRETGPLSIRHARQIKAGVEPPVTHRDIAHLELAAPVDVDPLELLDRQRMRQLAEQLPVRLRTIIVEHYYNDRPLRELAPVLGVNESRVSQLHGRAMTMLRQRMEKGESPSAGACMTRDAVLDRNDIQERLECLEQTLRAHLARVEKASASDARRISAVETSVERLVTMVSNLEVRLPSSSVRYGETVSVTQAATICGVARRTIYNWMASGRIRYGKGASGRTRIFRESLTVAPEPTSQPEASA